MYDNLIARRGSLIEIEYRVSMIIADHMKCHSSNNDDGVIQAGLRLNVVGSATGAVCALFYDVTVIIMTNFYILLSPVSIPGSISYVRVIQPRSLIFFKTRIIILVFRKKAIHDI